MSRDLTVFQDDDTQSGYLAYASEDNKVMHIAPLTPDFTGVRNMYNRVFINQSREAPAMFKYKDLYLMATSGCTGWEANRLVVYWTRDPMGDWFSLGNPCRGSSDIARAHTFFSQPTFVLPVAGQPGKYVFMADMWEPEDLASSKYVWLPMFVEDRLPTTNPLKNGIHGDLMNLKTFLVNPEPPVTVEVHWHEEWQLSDLLSGSVSAASQALKPQD
jgi:hypothetical protein